MNHNFEKYIHVSQYGMNYRCDKHFLLTLQQWNCNEAQSFPLKNEGDFRFYVPHKHECD